MSRLSFAVVALVLAHAAAAVGPSVTVTGIAPTLGGTTLLRRTTVPYGDVNPAEAQGANVLLARIRAAADLVCTGGQPSSLLRDKIEKCRNRALAQAVSDVGSPALSAAARY